MHLPFSNNYGRFEQLAYQHQHRIYGFACYLLTDHEEAADVTQEVLLRLWNHRDAVGEAQCLGWLLRVTRNLCYDELRRRKSYRNVVVNDSTCLDEAVDYALTPDSSMEEADFQERLQLALGRLAEPYRSIVILREIQDLTYEDISVAMDLPLNTTKVYLHRGRKMLRDVLKEVIERENA